MRRNWTEPEIKRFKELMQAQRYTYREIAQLIGRGKESCAQKAVELGLRNPTYRKRITKHAHLRVPVFKYFLNHTWDQTKAHFGLSQSELKSLFTVGYRDPKLKKFRKDKRRKDPWSIDETLFLVRNAGIQPRSWIAKRLKRGGVHSVKEALARLGHGSKHTNGMPYKWAQMVFGDDAAAKAIKTKAGPPGGHRRSDFRFRIIPWVVCERLARKRVPEEIYRLIRMMAVFQRWIYQTDSTKVIVQSIRESIGGNRYEQKRTRESRSSSRSEYLSSLRGCERNQKAREHHGTRDGERRNSRYRAGRGELRGGDQRIIEDAP